VREFKETRYWEKNFPEIRITDGKVSSPVEQPFTFEEDDFVFILDTRDATKELDLSYRNGILLTRTDLIYRSRPGETRHYSLEKFPNLILNQATVERFLQLIRNWTWVVTAFFLTIWFWIAKLIQVLFWSLLSLVVNAITKRSLPYRALFNIGVLALTVPFAFDLVKDTLGLRAPGLGWISLALYVGYLIWGILVQSKPVQSDLP